MQLAALIGTAQHFIQAFSWMLIHSLWQGILLAIVTAIILMLTKRTRSVVRYNLVFLQFALFLLTCGITFMYEWDKSSLQAAIPGLSGTKANGSSVLFNISITGINTFARTCVNYFTANAPFIVLLWFVLFLFRAVRVMGGLVYIHRAKHRLVYQPAVEWKAKVNMLCQKLRLKKAVQLLESGYVKMPMVIGHLKPVILVPVGLLAGLPAGQVEAVLLHELAHIRRNDYVVNFMQTIAETVFFFNPGLLWISSLLRDERENCCDDFALDQTKNKREFIEALISFKEHSLYGVKYEVAFPGKKNHLLNRVSRILNNKNKTLAPAEKTFFIAGVIALSVMVATAAIAQVHTTVSKHRKPEPVADASAPVKNTATVKSTITIVASTAKRKSHLPTLRSTGSVPKLSTPQHPINLADDLNKLRDKFRTDQARLSSIAKAQIDMQGQQEQNRKDLEQARIDQEQAKKDEKDVLRQRDQQNIDQAKKNEEQAKLDAEQAKRNQVQDALNDEQAKRNQEQAERNKQQEQRNALQARKNEEQNKLNEKEMIRNQERAKKNQESIRE